MYKCFITLFLICQLTFPFVVTAQTLVGTSGLINTPSAEISNDGGFTLGITYMDKKYVEHLGIKNNNAIYFGFFNFLPFLEVGFRFTKQINYSDALGDRLFSAKLRIINENTYFPSIAIGAQDFYYTEENLTNRFNSLYAVITKNINLSQDFAFKLNVGNGFRTIKSRGTQYIGLFGGVEVKYSFIAIMIENDARHTNVGVSASLFKSIKITYAYMNFNYTGVGISCGFAL